MRQIQRRGRFYLVAFLTVLLVLLVSLPAAGAESVIPAKHLGKITLVHYAASNAKTKPSLPSPDNDYYELLGCYWDTLNVQFTLDPDGAPAGTYTALSEALAEWDAATSAPLFAALTTDLDVSPSLQSPDGVNTISFRLLAGYPKALAVTTLWYDTTTGHLVDTDVIFNTKYKWGVDPDGEATAQTLPNRTYDVRNVGTHEIGHVVGLDDLYLAQYRELTMYGYSAAKETIKCSLMPGDIEGTRVIYGN